MHPKIFYGNALRTHGGVTLDLKISATVSLVIQLFVVLVV